MIIAIRIVLALFALTVLIYRARWFTLDDDLPGLWEAGFVIVYFAITVGIPLAIACVGGFLKKSKNIFWNVFVAELVLMAILTHMGFRGT